MRNEWEDEYIEETFGKRGLCSPNCICPRCWGRRNEASFAHIRAWQREQERLNEPDKPLNPPDEEK